MATAQVDIEYAENLQPVLTKPKRVKIVVGGRGSTKSTGISDYVLGRVMSGELWCCARETQNSIEESVHRTLLDEIARLGLTGFEDTKREIKHGPSGGRTFYRGLARNITSLKSTLSGVHGLWIEEGEDISANTLRILTASVRLSAKDSEKKLAGEDIRMPEIIITMNRGSRTGAIAEKWLSRAERELQRCGYYEDDMLMVVQVNHTDMPRAWFLASGLEPERLDDERMLTQAMYDHKWNGHYLDEVKNSIIKPEWFDASIDAHLNPKLERTFQPHGARRASHDPSDGGKDAKGYVLVHGSIVKRCLAMDEGEIDEGCDWATGEALNDQADLFIWDGDGMGAGLKRQVSEAFAGTRTNYHMFRGSLSGIGQDNAKNLYLATGDDKDKDPKTFADTFLNNRAQYYICLRDRFYKTYLAVVKGAYVDPLEMISLASAGIPEMARLRSEITRIPSKANAHGLIQIMGKEEMARLGIKSPNMADSLMMSQFIPPLEEEWVKPKVISRPRSASRYAQRSTAN